MKQTIFTFLLLSTIALVSCRKNGVEQDIKQYDQSQIQSYISANGITGMMPDPTGGDTSGIYYKPILSGSGNPLQYSDSVSFVFTIKSFDGKYVTSDTLSNHYQGYVGHIGTSTLPYGLELAILNDLKYRGGSMRVLIPSHLAYGVLGYGTGSKENPDRIAGNQCLDYYVHVISNQGAYDDLVIKNYLSQNSLTGYNRTASKMVPGLYYYYKIDVPGTGTDTINQNSTITTTYEGRLLDENVFDNQHNAIADTTEFEIPSLVKGVQESLSHATTGATVSMIIPSGLAYGQYSQSGGLITIPVNSCLRFEFEIKRVFP